MRLIRGWMALAALTGWTAAAEVPELVELVPDAKDYELIARFDPTRYAAEGCAVDRSLQLTGDVTRVGYLVKLPGNDGKTEWVFAEMDPFTKEIADLGVPVPGGAAFQTTVKNLAIRSNSPQVKTGNFAEGNVEIWGNDYDPSNGANVPGALPDKFDFGDRRSGGGSYGSLQVHNTAEKQTVFAFNNFNAGKNCDLGIGNNPGGNPDWTFAGNAKKYNSPEIFIVAKIDNMKVSDKPVLNPARFLLLGTTDKNAVSYQPGETMTFTLTGEFAGQKPEGLQVAWTRTGDDGKKETGRAPISADNPVVIKTQLDQPGFVYIYATLVDADGKPVTKQRNGSGRIVFEGGAGVQPEKLTSSPEPADFDQFWARQREKLAAVPVKAKMEKVKTTANADIYAVSVDCAGPRPVTGYLTIPVNAAEKSLPVRAMFQGYGTGVQGVPGDGPTDEITFNVNAHGYDLGRDGEYYKEFFENIKSNGQAYAFDPVQNSDPETAYFNGMALRVMRALEFLKTLPQWNGRDLVVTGGSQGGLQTVWAAALDPDVTLAKPDIPWCSDLAGTEKMNRLSGGWRIKYVPALDYYDTVHHAKRVKCRMEIPRAGLGDYVCPPSGVSVLYNNFPGPKKITYFQGSTHGYVPPKSERFVLEQE